MPLHSRYSMRAGILRRFLFWIKYLHRKTVCLKIDYSPADGEQMLSKSVHGIRFMQLYRIPEPQRDKISLCGCSLLWTIQRILCYIL